MNARIKKRPHNVLAHVVAAIGAGIILTELFRYWLSGHPMEGSVIGIGFVFGFVGAYMSDRERALEGGEFLVNSFTRVVAVVRSGRRATDAVVVKELRTPETPEKPEEWR